MKALILLLVTSALQGATFGTAVSVVGGATDIVLDESRGRLYVVNSTQNRVDVFTTAQRTLTRSIPVSPQPLSAAMSRDGSRLYVTSYSGSSLDIVDLSQSVVTQRVSLPAAPEGVAVGGDERVLITTVGSGNGNAENRLLLYDPFAVSDPLRAVPTTLPAPAAPSSPSISSRVFMSTRSNLVASADGNWIIGLNNPNTTTRQLFVFEVSSGTVLRSRSLTSISNVLSVAPDGSRFMAGLSLFDTATLAIVAQQNTANSMQPFDTSANFNTQQNQGGSVFGPDGSVLYSAFNIAPVQNPVARANVTQLLLSDPENLLIRMALQLPENLTGNMVVSTRGDNIYALSQSGFMVIPISTMNDFPIAVVDQPVGLVLNDQCKVTADFAKAEVRVRNAGRGRLTATATVMTSGPTNTFPIGGQGGAGAGGPGQNIPIVLPVGPGQIGGGVIVLPPGTTPPTTTPTTTTQQTGITQTAPSVSTQRTDTETIFTFSYNASAARSLGTAAPTDFLVQAPEAINVAPRIRVYQNNRNSEARGEVKAVPVSIATAEALVDMALDSQRQRLYIANSGMNRVEVYDTQNGTFLTPIRVGQLPRSLAIAPGNKMLYVANTGGESISIIDLDAGQVTGKVRFPPVPYNASFALATPSIVTATLAGVQIVMSDGTLWQVVDDEALPRKVSPVIGSTTVQTPRTMVSTPGGEYALLLAGNGNAYLYDAMSDDYVLSQSVATTPIQGYYGPLSAGPRGQYFVVNGQILNSTLTPIAGTTTGSRPVAAVAAVNSTMVARFTQPVLANATTAVRDTATVELVDTATGQTRGSSAALEGPLSTQVGTQRVNVGGRTMAVDAATNTAYVLTASGLSVIPISTAGAPGQPGTANTATSVRQGGVVNMASAAAKLAAGGLISINGQNLGSDESVANPPLKTVLGGTCVTLDETPIPLLMSSSGQINAQLPPATTAGRHMLVVRAFSRNAASSSVSIDVVKMAPAVLIHDQTGQASVFHDDGTPVTNNREANRDESLTMYAIGLGATTGGTVKAGEASPTPALATSEKVQVFFGDPKMKQSEMIVDWSGLAPGLVGIYYIELRVPGFRTTGDNLPVTIRVGGLDSPTSGAVVPTTAVK